MIYKVAVEEFVDVVYRIFKRKNPQLEFDI